jgi:RNA polymerase sigma factor FliA
MDFAEKQTPLGEAGIKDVERDLWLSFKANPTSDAHERLVAHYLPYVRSVAARYFAKRGGLEAEFCDYQQLAIVGLLESIQRYDPCASIGFISYAQHRIEGSILNGLPKLSEQHAQLDFQKRVARDRVNSILGADRGKTPTKSLLDEMVDLTVGLGIGFMLDGSGLYQATETPNEYDGYTSTLLKESKVMLSQQLDLLPTKERYVLRYHYLFDFSFDQIATQLELTKGRVSQLHRQGLQRLREMSKQADVLNIAV